MNNPTHPQERAHELHRALGYTGSTAIVIGTIIGSGIFLVPHDVAQQVGSVETLMLVWLIGGVLSLAGALSLAELGAANPAAGGIYVYLRDAYGKLFAFSMAGRCSWSSIPAPLPRWPLPSESTAPALCRCRLSNRSSWPSRPSPC